MLFAWTCATRTAQTFKSAIAENHNQSLNLKHNQSLNLKSGAGEFFARTFNFSRNAKQYCSLSGPQCALQSPLDAPKKDFSLKTKNFVKQIGCLETLII
jgi:hypothetical protein